MAKPKGGRGYKAPYETHQIRVPDPIATQVHSLIEKYQEFIEKGGNAVEPPEFLQSQNEDNKDVDNFKDLLNKAYGQIEMCNTNIERALIILKGALKLKANSGGAIKREIEKSIQILQP
ncbi:MAG: hypothetical protein JO131_00945 [Gammaproteobacteria bacterium]|nr:hypothetical protein [Gammaproteobacteria bacterium]